ncbi:hypothetical protein GCM10010524_00460 [Streptomyces mexicanus]
MDTDATELRSYPWAEGRPGEELADRGAGDVPVVSGRCDGDARSSWKDLLQASGPGRARIRGRNEEQEAVVGRVGRARPARP